MKLLSVLKETFFASLPLAAIIIIVCCFVAPMPNPIDYVKLIIGYAGVVIGQSVFLVGLDVSILPIGKAVGESLSKFKKPIFIVFFGFLFGALAESAEPALIVFARQTSFLMNEISEQILIVVMATGIGIMVGFALYRILKDVSIKVVFTILYVITFLLAIFVPPEFIGIAFDGSGATTGDISVPFMLALGFGVAATVSKHKSNEDSFGIVGLASVGPILAIFIYGIIFKSAHGGVIPEALPYAPETVESFASIASDNLRGVFLVLAPITFVFLLFQVFVIKLNQKKFVRLLLGMIPVFVGLFIFLTCVDYGFAYAGKYIGEVFFGASRPEWFKWLLLIVGFVLGGAITLSEPAVTVLGKQIEEITNGHIKEMSIRITLALGLGVATVLAIIKIITQINLLWFLAPLYIIALCMMKFSSKMFVGLAFDSGGVTAGGLTSAFLTPFALGVAMAVNETVVAAGGVPQSILVNGFGIISFMSAVPLIAVQTLGIIYEVRAKKYKKFTEDRKFGALGELLPLYTQAADTQNENRHDAQGGGNGLATLIIIAERSAKDDLLAALQDIGIFLINATYGKGAVKEGYISHAIGFVPEINKVMLTCITTYPKTETALRILEEQFNFNRPNTGIAFTVSIDKVAY